MSACALEGLKLDQPRELRLDDIDPVELLGDHRDVVQKVRVVGILGERGIENLVGRLVVVRVAIELRRDLLDLDLLLARDGRQLGQVGTSLVDAPELAEHRRRAKLREPPALTVGNGVEALQRELVATGLLGDLREVGFDDAVVAVSDSFNSSSSRSAFAQSFVCIASIAMPNSYS